MNLNELTIKEAVIGLKKKDFSALELTEACLKRAKKNNKDLNNYITITDEIAILSAKKSDIALKNKKAGALCGIPFSVKDAICVQGVRSTGSAKILDNYIAPYEATVIKKIRDGGGVLIGKNNCDAFGHGASNENSMYGPVKNPHNLKKVAGGSSGGSAVSVADNSCLFSIAEDTGGSIRQPASFCGVVGLRPSYGRNSRYGIMPMASSFDTVGPIAKTVEDIALIMEEIAGVDPKDATTVHVPVPKYSELINKKINELTIGVPKEYFEVEGIDSEVAERTELAIESLKKLGCKVVPVSLPHTKYAIAVYYIIVPSEDSSNLARLDGIRYGVRMPEDDLFNLYAKSRAVGFPEEVKRRILIGTYALSAGYYDAYYKKAQKVRTLIIEDFKQVFKKVDALITPTSPFPAFDIGEKINDPISLYLSDAMVSPSAVAGMPALSVPAGVTKKGLPIGVQIIGDSLEEATVLNVGHWLQKSLKI